MEGRARSRRWIELGACIVALAATANAKEARPPKWSHDVVDTFFDDAREALEGERPDYGARAGERGSASDHAVDDASIAGNATAAFEWSRLITADVLETEIKRAAKSLESAVTTPSAFKGGGFKEARRELSELAVLFAVTAQWNGEARWQDSAAGLRDLFARAAANAKVGSDSTYRGTEARVQDLADLIRGGRPQVARTDTAVDDWSRVAMRPPLMQRLNIAQQEHLLRWLADEKAFQQHRDDVRHEAQVLALLANVIHREAFEFWDDDTFAGYADDLQQAASDVAAATESNNFSQARDALNRATNACANCHDGYRG